MKFLRGLFRPSPTPSPFAGTDHGLYFGWWINLNGERVATLDYRAWDIDSQFWRTYLLTPVSDRFEELGYNPDKWCEPNVELQSRFATHYKEYGAMMSSHGDNIISLRGLYISEEDLERGAEDARKQTLRPGTY